MYNKLTENDILEMEKEIEYRKLVVRPKLLEDVKETRAHGDLSENFEYHAAKKEKNRNESFPTGAFCVENLNDIDDECTVLEMFVKLAIRCDEDVMYDAEYGNRVDKWFWEFLDGLGLTKFNNRNYVSEDVDRILDDFNNRHYGKKGGRGCAFDVRKPLRDMQTTEIWYQMMWWLNEKYPEA